MGPRENEPMLLGAVMLVLWGGVNEGRCLVVPQGACFFSLPRPAPDSPLTQNQTSPIPSITPSLPPSGSTLEVHLLCFISPLAIGYVYHQCTIFVVEVCMTHLGKAYQFQMGLSQRHPRLGLPQLSLESNYSPN